MMLIIFLIITNQIEIKAELLDKSQKQLTVGDPFKVQLNIRYPLGADVSEPFLDSLGPFVLIEKQNKVVQEKGVVLNQYQIKLAAFQTGNLKLPSFKILHKQGDKIDTLCSNTPSVQIRSVLPADKKDINDIKDLEDFPNYLYFYIAGVVITVMVLGYFGRRLIKRFKKAKERVIPPAPPWIEALVAIDNIPVQEWFKKGWWKKYYYTLSEILKRYLERRFGFCAAEQTTTELLRHLRQQKVVQYNEFGNFFQLADRVKYAKYVPEIKESERAIEQVKELINKTQPREESEVKP